MISTADSRSIRGRVGFALPWPRIGVVVTLLLLPVIWFLPTLSGDEVLAWSDSLVYSLPMKTLLGRMLAAGALPLWNPYTFAGMPFAAALQAGVFYPPNWLFALLSPSVAMNVVVITAYHLALSGTYLFGRKLGLNRTGAMVSAISFTFGGFMMAHIDLTNFIQALVWLPWLLLAIEGLFQSVVAGRSFSAVWPWVAAGAGCIALQLFAGTPQANWMTLLICGPYWLFSITVRERAMPRLRLLAVSALMACSGVLLSAMQLLPAQELRGQGERARLSYEFYAQWPFHLRRLLLLIFPFFFGAENRTFYQLPVRDEIWSVAACCAYLGLGGLLLALIAVIAALKFPGAQRRQVWFWVVIAGGAVLLALGDNLPFGLNHLLYRVPVQNWFRCSYRHLFEFSFAAAVLAGLGASWLATAGRAQTRRVLTVSGVILVLLTAATTIAYLLFNRLFAALIPTGSAVTTSLTDAAALVPLTFLALNLAAIRLYRDRPTPAFSVLLLTVLATDLAVFGLGLGWRNPRPKVSEFFNEPPAISFIKAREADRHSFRLLSYSATRYPLAYAEMAYQNLPAVFGLQAVGGYDPMRPLRTAAVAGDQSFEGMTADVEAIGPQHQGFNLLNVKYLLQYEGAAELPDENKLIRRDGFPFRIVTTIRTTGPGDHFELEADDSAATELGIISSTADSVHLPQGAVVMRLRLHHTDGRVTDLELQAGRDTAEWAYDRADVQAAIRHARPPVAEDFPGAGFQGHNYLGRYRFDRSGIDYIEFVYARPEAAATIFAVSLYDAATGQVQALSTPRLSAERWRRVGRFGPVTVYENLKHLPRAWFVREVQARPAAEVLQAIKTGRLTDQQPFDPAQTALLETEDFGARAITLPPVGDTAEAAVQIARYEPQRIELTTQHWQPGFLVLSEIYYRGWDAWIDGQPTPVERVNYALRGVAVPAGDHRVVFVFRASSFRRGAIFSLIGLLILCSSGVVGVLLHRFRKPGRRIIADQAVG